MKTSTLDILQIAQNNQTAVGAFNIYNLEEIKAVIKAAEAYHSSVILQVHPKAYEFGGLPLLKACLFAANEAKIPVSVHFDHCDSYEMIASVLETGIDSVMADGSHLGFEENIAFTSSITKLAHSLNVNVEAELGLISGVEDDLSVSVINQKMTDPDQASLFVNETGVDMLAVCIGNIHGYYPHEPKLDFKRLSSIRNKVSVPLVMHGASGLDDETIRRVVNLGVSKINVNTDLRQAYIAAIRDKNPEKGDVDILGLMEASVSAVEQVVKNKIKVFGQKCDNDPFNY